MIPSGRCPGPIVPRARVLLLFHPKISPPVVSRLTGGLPWPHAFSALPFGAVRQRFSMNPFDV